MRISDWSSDVCSSDLPWPAAWRWTKFRKVVDVALRHRRFIPEVGRSRSRRGGPGRGGQDAGDGRYWTEAPAAALIRTAKLFEVGHAEKEARRDRHPQAADRKSTRLNSSH